MKLKIKAMLKVAWLWLITPVKPEVLDEEEAWFRAIR